LLDDLKPLAFREFLIVIDGFALSLSSSKFLNQLVRVLCLRILLDPFRHFEFLDQPIVDVLNIWDRYPLLLMFNLHVLIDLS
jgi:hypothetical protein